MDDLDEYIQMLVTANEKLAKLEASRSDAIYQDKKEHDEAVKSFVITSVVCLALLLVIGIIRKYACDDHSFSPVLIILLALYCGYGFSCFGMRKDHEHEKELNKEITKVQNDISRITQLIERESNKRQKK